MTSTDLAVRDPWERLPKEARASFHNFTAYRDLGPTRTIAEAARLLGKSVGVCNQQSRKYQWQARVDAFDLAEDRRRREERAGREREMLERHERQARVTTQAGMLRLVGRAAGVREDGTRFAAIPALNPAEFSPLEALRFVESGEERERLTAGLPTTLHALLKAGVSHQEYAETVSWLVETAMVFMDDENHEPWVRAVRAYGEGRR